MLNMTVLRLPCLENPRDGGAWWAAVYGVAQSRTRLKQLSSSSSSRASLVAQLVKKNLPAKQETRFDFWARKIHWRRDKLPTPVSLGFPGGSDGKESTCQCRRRRFDPWSRRSLGEGNGNPLQYSCLGSHVDRGAWRATVHGVAKSPLSD